MKKCKQGYYYCYKDKKCKRIPGGYRVGLGGYLRREREEEKSEDSGETETKKNGNGNGGNGGNGNGGNGGNGGGNGGGGVSESVMTKAQIKKRDEIADSMSTREFNKRYGKDRGKSVKYATATKLAMKEESNPRIPRKKGQPANSKKHSDLYTDENPKGTIHGLGFKDVATAKASVTKIKKSSRSHAHKIQAAIAMEQRARVMGKTSEAAVYRKFINSMKKKTEKMNEGWSDKYKKSIDCDNPKGFSQKAHCQGRKKKMNEEKKKDHEYSMARSELKTIKNAASRLEKKMGKTGEGELKAWVQSKITKAADYIDTAADYVTNEETCPICGHDPCQCLEGVITEKRDGKSSKDKGYSLRDWFKGGGWKQTGGKYDGKPCAKQPGQKTKPYCRDADDRAAMSKEERNKRAAKKRREDPNPNRKGKAKNVTQESHSNWRTDFDLDEGMAANAIRLGLGAGTAFAGLKLIDKAKEVGGKLDKIQKKKIDAINKIRGVKEGYDDGDVIRPTDRIKMGDGKLRTLKDLDAKLKDKKPVRKEEVEIVDEGKKDACYYKVKSRYSVWPSAYASGALVKCRKVGAKNWGNKTKKEEFSNWRNDLEEMASEKKIDKKLQKPVKTSNFNPSKYVNDTKLMPGHGIDKKLKENNLYSNWRDDFVPTDYETTDLIKADPIQVPPSNLQKIEEAKKCWKGYKKVGTQKLFGKTYNRCEKIKKEHYDWRAELEEGAAWTKKSGKNPSGGLNEKGRKSYERENPGSDLKRPSKKVGNKRRASFCARMKGMKKKLTSKKTANDPNSRINKSLRAWNC